MPAEGTTAKTVIAPRLLNEQLRSATYLYPCHDPARWPTIASSVHPSHISVALAPTLAKWREVPAPAMPTERMPPSPSRPHPAALGTNLTDNKLGGASQ